MKTQSYTEEKMNFWNCPKEQKLEASETTESMSAEENFLMAFEENKEQLCEKYHPDLKVIWEKSIHSFAKIGIPSRKDEEWKYTDVNRIKKCKPYSKYPELNSSPERDKSKIPGLEATIVVLKNGRFINHLSHNDLPQGVIIMELDKALEEYPKKFSSNYASIADIEHDAFAALNTAFARNGVFVYIPEGITVDKPIHITHFNSAEDNSIIQTRNLFVAGKNSKVQIIESFQGNSDMCFINILTEIVCSEGANVFHYQIGNGTINESTGAHRISTVQVHQKSASTYTSGAFTFGGTLVRNTLNVVPDEEDCKTNLYGIYMAKGKQHIDNHTFIDHKKPNCQSNELYIGILDDHSTGVFNGKVMVRPQAQKTNAFQSNRNILLTDDAVINTKPQLEIYADDVKCSHGATIGQLDEEAIWYLRTRGIPAEKAKAILLQAFAGEAIEKITIPALKNHVAALVSNALDKRE